MACPSAVRKRMKLAPDGNASTPSKVGQGGGHPVPLGLDRRDPGAHLAGEAQRHRAGQPGWAPTGGRAARPSPGRPPPRPAATQNPSRKAAIDHTLEYVRATTSGHVRRPPARWRSTGRTRRRPRRRPAGRAWPGRRGRQQRLDRRPRLHHPRRVVGGGQEDHVGLRVLDEADGGVGVEAEVGAALAGHHARPGDPGDVGVEHVRRFEHEGRAAGAAVGRGASSGAPRWSRWRRRPARPAGRGTGRGRRAGSGRPGRGSGGRSTGCTSAVHASKNSGGGG